MRANDCYRMRDILRCSHNSNRKVPCFNEPVQVVPVEMVKDQIEALQDVACARVVHASSWGLRAPISRKSLSSGRLEKAN